MESLVTMEETDQKWY